VAAAARTISRIQPKALLASGSFFMRSEMSYQSSTISSSRLLWIITGAFPAGQAHAWPQFHTPTHASAAATLLGSAVQRGTGQAQQEGYETAGVRRTNGEDGLEGHALLVVALQHLLVRLGDHVGEVVRR
jgi:hypothetical protein